MPRSRQYPHLRFAPQVDWQHVRPELLSRLNRLGALTNHIIVVFSGYRTDKYSAQVGGFAGDPHTRHIAVDANVDGKPIGSVIAAKWFAKVGLITGNQPNFYKGKPDPEHVQLGESPPAGGGPQPKPNQAPPQPQAPQAPIPDATANAVLPPAPLPRAVSGPPLMDPGTRGADDFNPRAIAELWNLVASQPGAQLDTLGYAQTAQRAAGG